MRLRPRCFLFLFLLLSAQVVGLSSSADASGGGIPLIMQGVGRTLFAVLQIPGEMLANSGRAFPFGLVAGTVSGAAKAVNGTMKGAIDMARGAAPYAKYMVFL